ncbi:multidrug and toxin extrusion protein 1-like [Polymixia lowei]
MEESSAKLFCCHWLRRRVPLAHREELYHILRMIGPLLLCQILNYLLPFVTTIFCGRLGNKVLAGYGLASATLNITTTATGIGLSLACDTLVSQTFGGRNLLRVGVILQRSVLILLLFCLPCWALLINTEAILLSLGQEPMVARIAQLYVTAYLPAVPAKLLHHLQMSYLQNQGIILPQMYTAVLANIANLLTNYVLLYWMDLGVSGSAAANTLSIIYNCAFLFAYIWLKKLHVKTWGGWSLEALQEWGSYMKLAIPSAMMVCFEWWIYEFGGFFAGMLSEFDLAAQHTVIMLTLINYMFPLSIRTAATVRVGNALGAGDTTAAMLTSKVSIALSVGMAVFQGLMLASTKTVIGFIFTTDKKIIDLVSYLMNAYCFLQFFDALVCVCAGILLGAGRQKIAAVANLIGYYCIGLPLTITLMFVAELGILGFWLGLLICVCIQSTFYIIVIFKLDWKRITEEAVKRARKKSHVALLRETAALPDPVGSAGSDNIANKLSSVNTYIAVGEEGQEGDVGTQSGHVAQQSEGGAPRAVLSTTQLIQRRGLTAFVLVAVLAVGVIVHSFVPLPEIPFPAGNLTVDWINTTRPPDQIQSTTSLMR